MNCHVKLTTYFRQRNRGVVLSLLLATGLIYLPFIGNPFVFDDPQLFSLTSLYADAPFQLGLRLFPIVTLAWTQALFYDMPHVYRLGNLLLHGASAVLLFFLLHQIILIATPKEKKYSEFGAWLGALFFVCNPAAVYAVGYMIQRSTLMATLFSFAMQLAYLRGLVCEQKFGQRLCLTLSVIFYFFAVFSKEHSLMAPLVVMATTILLYPQIKVSKQSLWLTWLGYLIVAISVTLLVKGVFGTAYEIDAADLFAQQGATSESSNLHLLSALTQAGLFFKYLILWLLPNPAWMSIDMREPFISSLATWQNWLGAIGFIFYGLFSFGLLLRRGRQGLAGLALLYPWLLFIVEFSTVRIQEPFVLYRSYLWMPGMMLLFPLLLAILPNRKATLIGLTALVLALMPLSWNRLWVFADNYRLWNDAAILLPDEHFPGAARIYYNRGNAELAARRWIDAVADYQRVEEINPNIEQTYKNTGAAYFGLGKYKEAIDEFNQAITINPDYADAYFGKSMALKRLERNEEALENMKKSCGLKNNTACIIVGYQSHIK